jgi:hypothetical protein
MTKDSFRFRMIPAALCLPVFALCLALGACDLGFDPQLNEASGSIAIKILPPLTSVK